MVSLSFFLGPRLAIVARWATFFFSFFAALAILRHLSVILSCDSVEIAHLCAKTCKS